MRRLTWIHRLVSVAVIIAMMGFAGMRATSTSAHTAVQGPPAAGLPLANLNINAGDASFVKTLDPALPTDSISYYSIQLYQANLVKFTYPSLNIVPDLATWTVSPNHKVYTFTIKPTARFNNGDKVTAGDALWSLDRAAKPATKSPVASLYLAPIFGADKVFTGKASHIAGVKLVNSRTLRITLAKPYAYFLGSLTYPTADVLDYRVMHGKTTTYLTNHCAGDVGAGPFEFVCANKGSGPTSYFPSGHSPYFLFQPNPFFYGAKPHIRIYAPFMADVETNWRLFQSGAVDATSVPTADIGNAKHLKGYAQKPAFITDYITPNQDMAPFNNINCRLAVAYAIDRKGITQQLLKGTEAPLYDVIPPGFSAAAGGKAYFGYEKDVPYYNTAKAKAYLNACPGKLSGVSMTFQNTGADIAHEYDVVRADLAAIGANITLKPLTFNEWLNVVGGPSMDTTKTQITENLWIDDYPDAQDWLSQLLQSTANYDIGGFKNPTYDELVNRGNVTANPTTRGSLYRRAMKIAVNNGAWIGVGFSKPIWVVRPKLHNLLYVNSNIYPLNGDWSTVTVR
jgi:oligopeptide transport system substrate-binding protein